MVGRAVYIAYDTVVLGFVFVQTLPLLRPSPQVPIGSARAWA